MNLSRSTTNNALPDDDLDLVFMALANRTRREMLRQLSENGSATMSELAAPFDISQPGASKHVRVLERASLINRDVDGRVHRCRLDVAPLDAAHTWLRDTRHFWESQLDSLVDHFTKEADDD